MAFHNPSMERSAPLRSSALSLANICLIGLRSGEWRQVEQAGADRLDRLAHAGDLVGGKIVHDHDVAGCQGRGQTLLDPG